MLTPKSYKFCTHINEVLYPQPSSPLQSPRQHQHCHFTCLSLLLMRTHASPLYSALYRLFIQFSHTHLTFLSLAKGNFRGSFTPLWFSWGEFHQGTSFFRGYSYMSRRKVWERVRIQDMRLVFLPRKDGERKKSNFWTC